MLTTNKQRTSQVYDYVRTFHETTDLPSDLPDPQHKYLLPTLRPYQRRGVRWMLFKELCPSYYENQDGSNSATESKVLLPKGGILADEMGLGKTVEVLACLLTNTRKMDELEPSVPIKEEEYDTKDIKTDVAKDIKVEAELIEVEDNVPTEVGTVEVESINNGTGEDSKNTGKGVRDSGCLVDFDTATVSQIINPLSAESCLSTTMQNITDYGVKTEFDSVPAVTNKRGRKQVKFDKQSVESSAEIVEQNVNDSGYITEIESKPVTANKRGRKRDRFDTQSVESSTEYIVQNIRETVESTIESVVQNARDSGCVMEFESKLATSNKSERKQFRFDTQSVVESSIESVQNVMKGDCITEFECKPTTTNKRGRKRVRFEMQSEGSSTLKSKRVKVEDSCKKRPRRAAAEKGKIKNYILLHAWYEECLSEVSPRTSKRTKRIHEQSSFRCCCVREVFSEDIIECHSCNTWQHVECVGYDERVADYQYHCFMCWPNQPLLPSAGTVIISPEAISQQWVSEIEKHVQKDNLKVLVYEGVRSTGYLQPHVLASYDVVITTYEVLTKELNYTEPVVRSLRHAKRFFAPTSPLLFVQWWRLCLDEAQMVEGSTCRAAEMAKKFSAINKWAITGTPIQRAVNDLVGLMEFLGGSEYPEFLELVHKDWRSLLKMVPRVLWRTQMKDVLEETGVPPQTAELHLLDFSKIEKYFYQSTHTECSEQFLERIRRFRDLNFALKSLDRKVISNLLAPLLKLRQACLHPQAVRGKFLSMKKTMTMEDLVTQMVANAKNDAEQALRQLVAALNGTGAMHVIRHEWKEAVEMYRAVLHLEHDLNGRLKIDSLQRIHTMYNLAEVLDVCHEGIPPTLRDATLRDDVRKLELKYISKHEVPMAVTEKRVDVHAGTVAAHLQGATLGYSHWWSNILEWSADRDELLDKLKAAITHTDTKLKNAHNNLAHKFKSLYVVRVEVARWLAELDRTREEVLACLRDLRLQDTTSLANTALLCHIRPNTGHHSKGRNTKCKVCKTEAALISYETLLFEEKSKEKRKTKRDLFDSSTWTNDKEFGNKIVAGLVDFNVKTFESGKKGFFNASPFEKILKALASYGRLKQAPNEWLKEGKEHIVLFDKLKKEFLDLNLLWRQVFDLVDAKDELNMCKMRLRLPVPGEEGDDEEEHEPMAKKSTKKKKSQLDPHVIQLYRVESELHELQKDTAIQKASLKKKIGTLGFLENLQKEGTSICPICRNDLTDKWAVLHCGHCVCLDCLSSLLPRPVAVSMLCPQCRQPCSLSEVSYVDRHATQDQPPPRELRGSHSTKVTAVLAHTLKLIEQQPDVKILVFSAWEKVLDLLAEAFAENTISFRRLDHHKQRRRQSLKDFKNKKVTVLLLPLRSGAKGLNLVEASHVFLVEPILNPAEELQAVGRVHRIGQTKPTVVHRFIVQGTIEERILAAVAASGADQWSDDCITLQQLFHLFSSDTDFSLVSPQDSSATAGNIVEVSAAGGEDSDSDDVFQDASEVVEELDETEDVSDDLFETESIFEDNETEDVIEDLFETEALVEDNETEAVVEDHETEAVVKDHIETAAVNHICTEAVVEHHIDTETVDEDFNETEAIVENLIDSEAMPKDLSDTDAIAEDRNDLEQNTDENVASPWSDDDCQDQ